MLTVVFVADDRETLKRLRRATRPWPRQWELHFARGGCAALALLDELPDVDVVVSDLHMPAMDGAQLLAEVRARRPLTARIVLLDEPDPDSVARAIGPAHQILLKPVDGGAMSDVIEQVRAAAGHVLGEPVRTLVGRTDRLPSPPSVMVRVSSVMGSARWSLRDVSDVISEDVALTAEILKVVNSALFGLAGTVDSVEGAVSLLGADTIKGIIVGQRVFVPDESLSDWLDVDALGRRSRSVAFGARGLALRNGAPRAAVAEAFIAGMVAEVGLLVMARLPGIDPSAAAQLNTHVDLRMEQTLFGGNRFRVGCYLLGLWGFDRPVIDAIAQLACPGSPDAGRTATYLHLARRLVADEGLDPHALADPDHPIDGLPELLESVPTH